MSQVGILIKFQREKLGISQIKIAKVLGLTSPQFISNIERGLSTCPVPMMKRISKLLKLEQKDFLKALEFDLRMEFIEKWGKE